MFQVLFMHKPARDDIVWQVVHETDVMIAYCIIEDIRVTTQFSFFQTLTQN
jgi:hypothetical protein